MKINDIIYGQVTITEPVLLDVMASQTMTRLKGVLMAGITGLIGVTAATSRFEHSVGTMLLGHRLGADVPEQLAALLHDVSHTAFSHVMDHVFGDAGTQAYHDQMQESCVAGSDLPQILAKHGIDWRTVLDETRYPLLEQPTPALCADRVDYSLRDGLALGLIDEERIDYFLAHLTVYQNRIVMDDVAAARKLADMYMAADDASWSNWREVGLYELTAKAIKRALAIGVLTDEHIWGTDAPAWAALQTAEDEELQAIVALINPHTKFVWDEEQPDFQVATKIRTIDPDVITPDGLQLLSDLDVDYGECRQAYINKKSGVWMMRVV